MRNNPFTKTSRKAAAINDAKWQAQHAEDVAEQYLQEIAEFVAQNPNAHENELLLCCFNRLYDVQGEIAAIKNRLAAI